MILITGGLGFIGLHTARALLEMRETCILTQHRAKPIPEILKEEVGSRLFIEKLDVTETEAFLKLGEKYPITGIIHLAVSLTPVSEPRVLNFFKDIQTSLSGLANALEAAQSWKVKRILFASSLNIYSDVKGIPWREDQPLFLTAPDPAAAFKKSDEVVADYLARQAGIECIAMRFGTIYGPLCPWPSLPTLLVQSAVSGTPSDLANVLDGVRAEEGGDLCYVKDAAWAIALLMAADTLPHRVYNVSAGRPTTNRDVVKAVQSAIPGAGIVLPSAGEGAAPQAIPYQDITRLRQDTGFAPQYTTQQAFADYVGWVQADSNVTR